MPGMIRMTPTMSWSSFWPGASARRAATAAARAGGAPCTRSGWTVWSAGSTASRSACQAATLGDGAGEAGVEASVPGADGAVSQVGGVAGAVPVQPANVAAATRAATTHDRSDMEANYSDAVVVGDGQCTLLTAMRAKSR